MRIIRDPSRRDHCIGHGSTGRHVVDRSLFGPPRRHRCSAPPDQVEPRPRLVAACLVRTFIVPLTERNQLVFCKT
jgi:hypothetical protein